MNSKPGLDGNTCVALVERLPRIVSLGECGRMLAIGRTKLYDLISSNELRSLKIGARRYVCVDEIDRYILKRLSANEGK